MEKENNVTPITESPAEQAAEEVSLTVKFSKPYRFEDKTYKEIDLSGLDNLTAEDMIAADKYLTRKPDADFTFGFNTNFSWKNWFVRWLFWLFDDGDF